MHSSSGFGNNEIIQVADAVAREKGISRDSVIEAMEFAIQAAAKRKYGQKHNIKAEIDRKTGKVDIYRVFEVVENVENSAIEVSLNDAKAASPDAVIGDQVTELLPPIDLGRVAAQSAKQIIIQKVRDAERDRQFEAFINRVGDIMNGVVKRLEFGDIIVDVGRDEAVLKKESIIKNEIFRPNDKIRVYVEDVRRVVKGPQIFLSRTHDNFLAKLFAQEVPEIYDGVIEIKSVAREPGSRAKIAVYCRDSSIDPIGSCVGIRGSRVQAVVNELQGEKIDIIAWSSNPATFVVNALTPAEVSKVVIDEDKRRIEVVVPTEQLSLAIGRKGQNVRLASKLTNWHIDILTEDEESKRRSEEFNNLTELFMSKLDVEEMLAQLLAAEGFTSVEDIYHTSDEDLLEIEGFDENLAKALKTRAEKYITKINEAFEDQIKTLGVAQSLLDILDLPQEQILKLAEEGIKTPEDLAELTLKEFNQILPNSNLSGDQIKTLINEAKNHID
ncbi:MAG: transcription termination factor NusA [Rickettsiales bacterium]